MLLVGAIAAGVLLTSCASTSGERSTSDSGTGTSSSYESLGHGVVLHPIEPLAHVLSLPATTVGSTFDLFAGAGQDGSRCFGMLVTGPDAWTRVPGKYEQNGIPYSCLALPGTELSDSIELGAATQFGQGTDGEYVMTFLHPPQLIVTMSPRRPVHSAQPDGHADRDPGQR